MLSNLACSSLTRRWSDCTCSNNCTCMARSSICYRALDTLIRWYSRNAAGVRTSTSSSGNSALISWNLARIRPAFMTSYRSDLEAGRGYRTIGVGPHQAKR
uniref:Uncharacterized protein n=1 Tax=Arundo donax TaxID=35708 RepID=A0A0A9DNX3_ARUDO